jgi:CII-binding regulator of phage lambda lysogenization HflD
MHIICATPDLILKDPDATLAIYGRQMKHLKHASETIIKKTHENI